MSPSLYRFASTTLLAIKERPFSLNFPKVAMYRNVFASLPLVNPTVEHPLDPTLVEPSPQPADRIEIFTASATSTSIARVERSKPTTSGRFQSEIDDE
jgi:hypothetical protein